MVTHAQHESGGTVLHAVKSGLQDQGRALFKKRGLLSGRIPLVTLFLFALALSVAFPYGIGLVVFVWIIALVGAIAGVGIASFILLKELFGRTSTFGYAPTTAYLAGKKTKKKSKEASSQEADKDSQ
jgi:hypothetical protein